ncbi:MAG: ABC transporter permease [Gemmatimonadetes bacterium]|nr:MAG: ABC transporter permease [Gemmatimonadota bacterium]
MNLSRLWLPIDTLGQRTIEGLTYLKNLVLFFSFALTLLIQNRHHGRRLILREVISQIYFTGVNALPFMSVIGLVLGFVTIAQYRWNPLLNSGTELMGEIFHIVILREFGPLVTAYLIIGRSGTALAAHIGDMRISHQIDALEAMGISPLHLLIAPRILGGMISMTCLSLYVALMAMVGGMFISGLSFFSYFGTMFRSLSSFDLLILLFKSLLFGMVIPVIACYHGWRVQYASTEVPQQASLGVVNCMGFIFIINGTITAALLYRYWG